MNDWSLARRSLHVHQGQELLRDQLGDGINLHGTHATAKRPEHPGFLLAYGASQLSSRNCSDITDMLLRIHMIQINGITCIFQNFLNKIRITANQWNLNNYGSRSHPWQYRLPLSSSDLVLLLHRYRVDVRLGHPLLRWLEDKQTVEATCNTSMTRVMSKASDNQTESFIYFVYIIFSSFSGNWWISHFIWNVFELLP